MRIVFSALIIITQWLPVYSQLYEFQSALPGLINLAKTRSVPIICTDSSFTSNKSYGTGVLVGGTIGVWVLTCEHVIAIKDSITEKTTRYKSDIIIKLNRSDGTSEAYRGYILHADEEKDFAILGFLRKSDKPFIQTDYNLSFMGISSMKKLGELREGEPVLYIGYPLKFGIVKEKNYPLSRIGIISQIRQDKNTFLIDGFVQGGHSGSPVYRIVQGPSINEWSIELIGIARAYPREYGKLLEEIAYRTKEGYRTVLNPGFTYVVSMDDIIPVLDNIR